MSREAFGDPPESQEAPDLCPVCGNDWHAEDCEFGQEVARRLKAERDAHRMQFALHRTCGRRNASQDARGDCAARGGCWQANCVAWGLTFELTGQTRRGNHDRRTDDERRGWSG